MAQIPVDPADALVLVEHRDRQVVVVTLNNGKVNPLTVDVLRELEGIARGLANGSARAVIITGNDRAFAAGADIKQFVVPGTPDDFALANPAEITRIGSAFLDGLNAVASIPCPTIAAVSGVAFGGGCELALACDFRISGERAKFSQPEILLGIIPGGGGTQRLARLVGSAKAKDLVFSGRVIDSQEALRIGLVDRVVENDVVRESAIEWAEQFAAGPRHALALAKLAIDQGLETTLEEGLRLEQERFVRAFTTPDAAAGVRSFLAEGPGKARFE